MSGEETDGESSRREKQLARVPVRWINPELTRLFHVMDTWKLALADEGFASTRGNRPFARSSTAKESVTGHVTKALPRNWYDDMWYRSQSDAQRLILNTAPVRPILTLVGPALCLSLTYPY